MTLVQIQAEAVVMYREAGFRCCSSEEFSRWYEMADRAEHLHLPIVASTFCSDCDPLVRKFMIQDGLCVRQSAQTANAVRQAAASGQHVRQIAQSLGISKSYAQDILRGKHCKREVAPR